MAAKQPYLNAFLGGAGRAFEALVRYLFPNRKRIVR
jgi:hypothetical protein